MHAHHSCSVEFDDTKTIHVEGSVRRIDWSNPHVRVYLSVKGVDGGVAEWTVQMGRPAELIRAGLTQSTLKPDSSRKAVIWKMKRPTNLTSDQKFRLRDLLQQKLKTIRACLLKESFQQFWDYTSPHSAGGFLDEWCRQVMRSRIEPMKKTARMLRRHRELILNYFKVKGVFSSGVIEGLNNKAKVTMRKSYGFRSYKI